MLQSVLQTPNKLSVLLFTALETPWNMDHDVEHDKDDNEDQYSEMTGSIIHQHLPAP